MKNLFLFLYFTSQGDKTVFCEKLGHGYYMSVPGFSDDRFVTLDCGPGLKHIGIEPSKLDPAVTVTLESRLKEITTQYDKDIANALFSKVSKK
jgi:hypothetical protein